MEFSVGKMRVVSLQLFAVTLFVILIVRTSAFYISDEHGISDKSFESKLSLNRQKRQLENFDYKDDEFPASANQSDASEESSGFWDRVVKIAVKMFSRFIEWLNQ